jgi:hypothetical protein
MEIKIREYTDKEYSAVKVTNFGDITRCKRLFFEIISNNRPTGFFKEVSDVQEFIKLENELIKKGIKGNCSSVDYINHHNFQVIY